MKAVPVWQAWRGHLSVSTKIVITMRRNQENMASAKKRNRRASVNELNELMVAEERAFRKTA
jgi:hypothetical protein